MHTMAPRIEVLLQSNQQGSPDSRGGGIRGGREIEGDRNGAAEEPGILAWGVMGFCAVILVGQLVPAAMLVIGAVKGLATAPKEVKNH